MDKRALLLVFLLIVVLVKQQAAQITNDCEINYRCFLSPANCQGTNCKFVYKWRSNANALLTDFVLAADVNSPTTTWLGIGFSVDSFMGTDDVVICKSTNVVEHYRNNGKTTPELLNSANPSIGLTNRVVTTTGTWLTCSFTRQLSMSSQLNYFDLNMNFYVLAAMGALGANGLLFYHVDSKAASTSTFGFKFTPLFTEAPTTTTTRATTTTTRATTTTTRATTTTTRATTTTTRATTTTTTQLTTTRATTRATTTTTRATTTTRSTTRTTTRAGATTTTRSTTRTTTRPLSSTDTSDCGKTKGCFLDPPNCQGSACTFIFKYSASGNITVFDLSAYVETTSNPWLAIGFSDDQLMGNDGVCVCSNTSVEHRYNKPGVKTPPSVLDTNNPSVGITSVNVTLVNGWFRCRFTRRKFNAAVTNYFDLNKEYHVLAAYGPSTKSILARAITTTLQEHTERVYSTDKVNFNKFSIARAIDELPMIKSHACLMVFAWMLFASTGIIIARYYKFLLPDIDLCGMKFWFILHRPIMICVPVISIAAFLVILAANQWKWVPVESKVLFAHSIFGIVAICFAIIQPFIAIARCDKGDKKRPIFDHVHRSIGLSALLFSIIAIFLGTASGYLDLGNNGWGIILGWTIWLIGFVVAHEAIELRSVCDLRRKDDQPKEADNDDDVIDNRYIIEQFDSIVEPENVKMRKAEPPERKKSLNWIEIIKQILLIAHIVITIAFTLALVVLIGISE